MKNPDNRDSVGEDFVDEAIPAQEQFPDFLLPEFRYNPASLREV